MPRSEMLMEGARKTLENIAKQAQQVQVRREERAPWGWLPGVLLGLTAGVTAGLLLAPQRGEQTRALVQERLTEYTKELPERTSGAFQMARDLSDRIMHMFYSEERRARERAKKEQA